MVERFISCLLFVIIVIRFHKLKNGMFHPKVFRILELRFRTTFYHNITIYVIITGFLTKLAVIFVSFDFWFSTSDFSRNSSSKSVLRSWFRKLNYLRVNLAHQEKENLVIYFFIQKLANSLILEKSFRVTSWKPWHYSQYNKMRLFWFFFSKITKIHYFRTKYLILGIFKWPLFAKF